jgi:hypothetical protein
MTMSVGDGERIVQSLIEQLKVGHSDALIAYLNAMSRFHNYSRIQELYNFRHCQIGCTFFVHLLRLKAICLSGNWARLLLF